MGCSSVGLPHPSIQIPDEQALGLLRAVGDGLIHRLDVEGTTSQKQGLQIWTVAGSVPTTQGLAGNLTWATGLEMPLASAHYGKTP